MAATPPRTRVKVSVWKTHSALVLGAGAGCDVSVGAGAADGMAVTCGGDIRHPRDRTPGGEPGLSTLYRVPAPWRRDDLRVWGGAHCARGDRHTLALRGGAFHLEVTVPPNTTATVYVPTRDPTSVREGDLPAAEAAGVRFLRAEERAAVYAVGAGNYRFTARRGVS